MDSRLFVTSINQDHGLSQPELLSKVPTKDLCGFQLLHSCSGALLGKLPTCPAIRCLVLAALQQKVIGHTSQLSCRGRVMAGEPVRSHVNSSPRTPV